MVRALSPLIGTCGCSKPSWRRSSDHAWGRGQTRAPPCQRMTRTSSLEHSGPRRFWLSTRHFANSSGYESAGGFVLVYAKERQHGIFGVCRIVLISAASLRLHVRLLSFVQHHASGTRRWCHLPVVVVIIVVRNRSRRPTPRAYPLVPNERTNDAMIHDHNWCLTDSSHLL